MFYVGVSRARFLLSIVCKLSDDECGINATEMGITMNKRPQKALAAALNALLLK